MTFVRRRLGNDPHIQIAKNALKGGQLQEAVDGLSHALRTNGESPDYFWLRGLSYWRLARQGNDPNRYSSSLVDLQSSVALDPRPITEHDGLWPESKWALPAYAQILSKYARIVSDSWHKHLTPSRSPHAWKAANAIATMRIADADTKNSLLTIATQERDFGVGCPFRKALSAVGWKPSKDGYALVTEADIQRADASGEKSDNRCDVWTHVDNILGTCRLSKEERERLIDVSSMLASKDDATLQKESQSPERFIRAISCVVLCVRGTPPPLPAMLDELRDKDSHRLVRIAALHSITTQIEPARPGDEPHVAEPVSRLIQAATQDRAAACRCEAVTGLGRVADTLQRLNLEGVWKNCQSAVETALHDKSREVVIAAMEARRKYGNANEEVIDHIAQIHYETRHDWDNAIVPVPWRALCEKTKTVFAMTRTGSGVRKKCWDEFRATLCCSDQFVRKAGVETAAFIIGRMEFTDEAHSLLLERSWMDDSRDVRELAEEALKKLR